MITCSMMSRINQRAASHCPFILLRLRKVCCVSINELFVCGEQIQMSLYYSHWLVHFVRSSGPSCIGFHFVFVFIQAPHNQKQRHAWTTYKLWVATLSECYSTWIIHIVGAYACVLTTNDHGTRQSAYNSWIQTWSVRCWRCSVRPVGLPNDYWYSQRQVSVYVSVWVSTVTTI